MNGLEISRDFYIKMGIPMLEKKFKPYVHRIAVGLVGEGSECFGFDDTVSRDHDWGPGFCLWLTDEDYLKIGNELVNEYKLLNPISLGYEKRCDTLEAAGRIGVMRIKEFYMKFTGLPHGPNSLDEWRSIPESYLATVSNGLVFADELGEFSFIRKKILDFYPEDIRLKKIAARTAILSQSGQYNFERSIKRADYSAAGSSLSVFTHAACSLIHLLNKRYTPFYKWMQRSVCNMPRLGECGELISSLYDLNHFQKCYTTEDYYRSLIPIIENICKNILSELVQQGLTSSGSEFLIDHCTEIVSGINDRELREIHFMSE